MVLSISEFSKLFLELKAVSGSYINYKVLLCKDQVIPLTAECPILRQRIQLETLGPFEWLSNDYWANSSARKAVPSTLAGQITHCVT